ncbi:MAG: hypothetical protein QOJ84_3434 [Bradyrhizobium sp.]|jgi:hypothetical protein|nr:hypothetical protein [Bradyrhizobium sp.]
MSFRQRSVREQRARGEELQQAAAAGELHAVPRHRYWVPISPAIAEPNSSP